LVFVASEEMFDGDAVDGTVHGFKGNLEVRRGL
jgi:hypothetical protein